MRTSSIPDVRRRDRTTKQSGNDGRECLSSRSGESKSRNRRKAEADWDARKRQHRMRISRSRVSTEAKRRGSQVVSTEDGSAMKHCKTDLILSQYPLGMDWQVCWMKISTV